MEIAQAAHNVSADHARKDAAAVRSLEREDLVFAAAVAAAVSAALAGEEPEALGVEAPDRGIDDDGAVFLEQQRVGDLAGCHRIQIARLKVLQRCDSGEFVQAHERKIEQPSAAARGEVFFDGVHRLRARSRPPVTTQSAPARRRSATALATWASRTPAMTPRSSKTLTITAMRKSTKSFPILAIEPEVAATICSTWLVATAVSGT